MSVHLKMALEWMKIMDLKKVVVKSATIKRINANILVVFQVHSPVSTIRITELIYYRRFDTYSNCCGNFETNDGTEQEIYGSNRW